MEAPYIQALSMPCLPKPREAFSAQVQRLHLEDMQRLERRRILCEQTKQESLRLENARATQRARLEKARKQEKVDSWQRMKTAAVKREARWTQWTSGHPFENELWDEDCQVYDMNRVKDKADQQRRRSEAKKVLEDQAKRRKAKLEEPDVLGDLRREKKKLLEDQKLTKARLDLEKVDRRLAAAKLKADIRKAGHEEMLASKGHLDRAHADFFTEERLSSGEREDKRAGRPPFKFMRGTSSSSLLNLGYESCDPQSPAYVEREDADDNQGGASPAGGVEEPSHLGYTSEFDSSRAEESGVESQPASPKATSPPMSPTSPTHSLRSEPWASPEKFRAPPGEQLG